MRLNPPLKDGMPMSEERPVFNRFGRALHLRLADVSDLRHVFTLNEAHWVATSAPIETINADPVFLAWLDEDRDSRIRVQEIRRGVAWLLEHLLDHGQIRAGNTELALDAINEQAADGAAIRRAAHKVRGRTGDPKRSSITLNDVRRILGREQEGSLGRSGLVPPEAAPDEAIRGFLQDIIAGVGGESHPNGELGVSRERLRRFMDEAAAYLAWRGRGIIHDGAQTTPVMPFGTDTPRAFALFNALHERIDQYFALSHLALVESFLGGAPAPSAGPPEELALAGAADIDAFLARAPLAAPAAAGVLDLTAPLNPVFATDLKEFAALCLARLPDLEPGRLTAAQWAVVKTLFAAHADWVSQRPATGLDRLDPARLQDYLDAPVYLSTVDALLQDSHAQAIVLDNLRLVEKLILYQAQMLPLVNSFVSFPDLYDPTRRALFEMGTLIMDGRHFTLSVRVTDRGEHARLSAESNIFMLYLEISGVEGGASYEVAVPVTSGGRGKLQVGKWGIFQDLDGRERHARVMEIVENSISLYEAVAAPFRRLGAALAKKLQDVTASAEKRLGKVGSETVTQVADVSLEAKPAAAGPTSGGMLAGGGIAIAALGSSAAFITKTLSTLSWQGTLGGLTLAALAVVLPTAVYALFRLHNRDLSTLLEGSGWAINARMWLTPSQARTFTYRPGYDDHLTAARATVTRVGWLLLVLLLVALAWAVDRFGLIQALRALQ